MMLYPQLTPAERAKAWAAHVEDGLAGLRHYRSPGQLVMGL